MVLFEDWGGKGRDSQNLNGNSFSNLHSFFYCLLFFVFFCFFLMQEQVKTMFCETLCIQILPNRTSFSSLLLLLRAVLHSGQNLTT